MRMPTWLRKLAPALNWIVLAGLVGASVGALNAMRIASENSYFQESMRGLAGRVLETGALRGACLGLLTAAGGFVLFALAWPGSRLILRSSRMATVGAWTAVPIIALLAVAAYRLNLDVFPSLLSAASLLGNAVLVLVALLAWWLLVKWLARRQDSLRALAGNGVVMTTMAGLLVLLVGLPMGLARTWKVEVDARQPNVLIVLIDTLRADRLGSYGYRRDTSPHIDRVAGEGWRFDVAIAQASWTKPSVASMITGLYARQTSVSSGDWAEQNQEGTVLVETLAAEHLTLAEQLASHGYETAAFGKNHHLLVELGFSQGYLTYQWLHPAGRGALDRVLERFLPDADPQFAAEWINDRFVDWLDAKADRKFFAYLHHIDIHWPYESPPPFSGMFTEKPAPEDFNSGNFLKRMVSKLREDSSATVNPETLRAMNDAYDEGIRYVDDGLGRIFELLQRRGLYDDTLIIITADHGEEFMEHGLLGHGKSLYDEVIRVPLIVKFPCPGPHCSPRVVTSQVELVDVFPTVMQVLGIEPPTSLAGRSLAGEASASRAAFSEFKSNSGLKTQIALRTPEWKWIYDEQDDTGELYDLAQDPGEANDLATSEPALRELLSARVLDFAATHLKDDAVSAFAVKADERMLENLKALGYVQ